MLATHDAHAPVTQDPDKMLLAKRLDGIGWGLLLILTGALWLVPDQDSIQGAWLIGTGVLLLVLNGIRYAMGVGMSGLTTVLGVVALGAGIGEYFSVRVPVIAILFILVGGAIILKPLVERRT